MDDTEIISKFFEKHGVEPRSETSRSYIFDCPVCGGSDKLYIQKSDGKSICFKGKDHACPKPNDKIEYILSVVSGLTIEQVKYELEQGMLQIGDTIEIKIGDSKIVDKKTIEPMSPGDLPQDITPISSDLSADGRSYLEGRGITFDMMKKYGVMYSPGMRRVIFPVIMNGKIYGWQGRAVDKVDKKYRMHNMPGEWKSKTLMFHDNLIGSAHAIIAEGPVSALKFEKIGGHVATMGKMVSRDQLELILKSGVSKVYLALDRDAAENTAKIRDFFMTKIDVPMRCYLIEVPDHRDDFGDCTFEECAQAFDGSRPIATDEVFLYIDGKVLK